jgi:uncharacterized protein (DUF885 family)
VGQESFWADGYFAETVGKVLELLSDRARQLGDKFDLRQFMDDIMGGAIIPISLTRWEMTGFNDQMKKLW